MQTALVNRPRLRFVRSLSLVAVVVMLVIGCGPEGARRQDIGARLVSWAAAAEPGDRIALSDLTDFDWDRVLVGGPYTPNDSAREQLGFAWDAEKLPSYADDGLNFVAFASGNHVVAWATVPRIADIDMPGGEDASVYAKDAAIFVWDGHQLVPASDEVGCNRCQPPHRSAVAQ